METLDMDYLVVYMVHQGNELAPNGLNLGVGYGQMS